MKKMFLLTLLLAVAASATMTITFPDGPPTEVGKPVAVNIVSGSGSPNADLRIIDGSDTNTWVHPSNVILPYNGDIEITHDGVDLCLLAKYLGLEDGNYCDFDIEIGEAAKWQIVAPGETAVRGDASEPDGKSGTGAVTAAEKPDYRIYLCDKWYNIVDSMPTGYSITTDDPFGRIDGDEVELRTAEGSPWTVTVTGGSYQDDASSVRVNPGPPARLLLICSGETHLPGDTTSVANRGGKTGTPARAAVGVQYEIDVHVVDVAWNKTYPPDCEVYIINDDDEQLSAKATTDLGSATLYATFPIQSTGYNVGAKSDDCGIQTPYFTPIPVDEGIFGFDVTIDPAIGTIGVESDLTIIPYTDPTHPVGAGFPVHVELVETDLSQYFAFVDEGIDVKDTITLFTDQDGEAECGIRGDEDTTYTLRIFAVAKDTTDTLVSFPVRELTELLIYPNPYKYADYGDIDINFAYKVEQVGATEVKLLVADVFGNIAYTATYDSDSPEAAPGQNTIYWRGLNSNGARVASGMYQAVLKITLKNGVETVLKKNFILVW